MLDLPIMTSIYSKWTQIFPGSPSFTESSISSQTGRVFIVTGGSSGIGFELVKILYSKSGTVYMASRSDEKALAAIKEVKDSCPSSSGKVRFLHLDLDDLTTSKAPQPPSLSKSAASTSCGTTRVSVTCQVAARQSRA